MTMIDERLLTDSFAEIAAGLGIPEHGVDVILDRAAADGGASDDDNGIGEGEDPGRIRRTTEFVAGHGAARYLASHRRVSVAAAAVVVVMVAGITVGGLLGRGGGPGATQSAEKATQAQTMERQLQQSAPQSQKSALLPTMAPIVPATSVPPGFDQLGPRLSGNSVTNGSSTGATGSTPNMDSAIQASPSESSSNHTNSDAFLPATGSPSTALNQPAPLPSGEVGINQSIEKTGSVAIIVKRATFDSVMSRLTTLAVGEGGFVQDSQTSESSGSPTGTITLEVPVADFETALDTVRSMGKVDSAATQATNVTGQAVNLQAQIQALQDSLSQYEKILSQAYSIGDILSVQAQINTIQSQIQQLQAQQNLLNAVTVFSTLAVSVSTSPQSRQAPPPIHPQKGLAKAWHQAVSGFTTAFDGLVSIAGPLLFALICLVALLVLVRVGWRAATRLIL